MLKIKNIGRIVGMTADGRRIAEAGDYRDLFRTTGRELFVFKIDPCGDRKEYNREISIVLHKEPDINGKYYMFNMGLERVTGLYVTKDEISNPVHLSNKIREVLEKTKHFYNTK